MYRISDFSSFLDLECAERYENLGKIRKYEKNWRRFKGTMFYQSVEAMDGWTPSPIDDIHDLCLSMLEYSMGQALPWYKIERGSIVRMNESDARKVKLDLTTVEVSLLFSFKISL